MLWEIEHHGLSNAYAHVNLVASCLKTQCHLCKRSLIDQCGDVAVLARTYEAACRKWRTLRVHNRSVS